MSPKELILSQEITRPEIFRLCYPKVYNGVGGFTSPKIIGGMICSVISTVLDGRAGDNPSAYWSSYRPACQMVNQKMPMFFVTRELAQAAMATDYSDTVNWKQLELPFEAGVFVLPPGVLVHPVNGECGFIAWGRTSVGKEYRIKECGEYSPAAIPNANEFSLFTAAHEDKSAPWLYFTLTDRLSDGCPEEIDIRNIVQQLPTLTEEASETDTQFTGRMVSLGLSLLLIMRCRPELVSSGGLQRRVARGNKTTEFWTPNIIGKSYRVKGERDSSGEPSGSRRPHWVRGHMRNQAHGERFSLRKVIWIEPYWSKAKEIVDV